MNPLENIESAILLLKNRITQADSQLEDWCRIGEDFMDPSWAIESCFVSLLAITEAFGLEELRKIAHLEYLDIKNKKGFGATEATPDGDPYSPVLSHIRRFLEILESFCPSESQTKVTKDLMQIIRDAQYVITDKRLFGTTPGNEADVHLRMEGILKCVFSDLKHKPTLTKQIKNFEPDTGIPSIETLIEYKFLSRKEDVPVIADQLLADTRGYISNDWKRFLYVIYETHRFKSEKDWKQLFSQSQIKENTAIIVLCGEPPKFKKKVRRH